MAKKKLIRYAENHTFNNLFQYDYDKLQEESFPLKGKWHAEYFRNDHPIVLELGCGKGEYTVNLAKQSRHKNYIGIDLKGARIWQGCRIATDENMQNVAFIRTRVDFIEDFFAPNEVSEIWITFPDPQPQSNRLRKRLTAPAFLNRYHNILKPDHIIRIKTDSDIFYRYTREMIIEFDHTLLYHTEDLYSSDFPDYIKDVKTHYENIFLEKGKKIKYLTFRLNGKSE